MKWALGQLTLCGVAFAFVPAFWAAVSDYRVPNMLVFLGLSVATGAIVGGFFHRFRRGALIGAVVAMPAALATACIIGLLVLFLDPF